MSRVCYTDLRKERLALPAQINVLDRNTFQRRLAKLFREDEIGGPLAVAHILKQMRKIAPRREVGFLGFADRAVHASSRDQRDN